VLKRVSLVVAVCTLVAASLAFGGGSRDYRWQLTPTGSTASLRGLSAVSENVAWASGSGGTVLRTTNKGATWQSVGPPGTQALQFRDIEAFDRDTAVILSLGDPPTPPDSFRIYRTTNAGQTWSLVFQNDEPTAFYDCMAFFDKHRGLALSDPIDSRFRIIATNDGGRSWRIVDADMPPALPGEFAFAASGQCITTAGGRNAWFGGGGAAARVFHSRDRGQTWTVASTPMLSGEAAGISALAFRDVKHGLAVGGDFLDTTVAPDSLALSDNGGKSWELVDDAPNQLRSGAAWVTGRDAIIVGPNGSDVTFDQGRSWRRFDDGSFHTVDCAGGHACWASGTGGRVAYLVRDR
jgi:photosystem II stability/assembly factor-like uncharacterized protein